MTARRRNQIERGNNDDYWHRPWRVHAQKNLQRLEREKHGRPKFSEPLHKTYVYQPIYLRDYQKNELHLSPAKKARVAAAEIPAVAG